MEVTNITIDDNILVTRVRNHVVAVVQYLINGHELKEKMVLQILHRGKGDVIVDTIARKVLGVSLRDKGVKDPLAVEECLYNYVTEAAERTYDF